MSGSAEHANFPVAIQMVEMVGVSKENWGDAARQVVGEMKRGRT